MRTKTKEYAAENASDYQTEFSGELSDVTASGGTEISIEKIYAGSGDSDSFIENNFDVLIINSLDTDKTIYIGKNKKDAENNRIILLNSDEKNIFKALQNNVGSASVITYGLNSKACVTASSISDATVQFCIQRALPTLTGEVMEQQEFTVKADTLNNDVNSILAAVTAAILNGFDTNLSLE
jgi:UDP-N-acetylmuramate-alanine ligase